MKTKITTIIILLLSSSICQAQVNCQAPINLGATPAANNSVNLNWTEINTPPAPEWDIYVTKNLSAPLTPTPATTPTYSNIQSNPYTLNIPALLNDTIHCFFVRSVCSPAAAVRSAWTGPFCFTPSNTALNIQSVEKTNALSIYPNPSSEYITISTPNNSNIRRTISLLDISGRVLVTQEMKTTEVRINIRNFTKGVYIAQLRQDNQLLSNKMVLIQ